MKTIQVTLPAELHQEAKLVSLKTGRTLKQFVIEAIQEHVVRKSAREGGNR